MRAASPTLALLLWLAVAGPAAAATGRVIKVLPEYLDLQGRTALTPSLYDRDAYQAVLRDHPERRSGMRFFVQWKVRARSDEPSGPLLLRLELRGTAMGDLPKRTVLEEALKPKGGWFGHWAGLSLKGDEFKRFGPVVAWRVTLWEGQKLLSEQKSFLW